MIRAADVDLKQDTKAGDTGTTARIVGLVGDRVVLDSEAGHGRTRTTLSAMQPPGTRPWWQT